MSTNYAKPHYRLLSEKEIEEHDAYCLHILTINLFNDNPNTTVPPTVGIPLFNTPEDTLKVIRYFQRKYNKSLVIRNNQYCVVTYSN